MSANDFTSPINLGLPQTSRVEDSQQVKEELQDIYNAFRTLQLYIATLEARIAVLEQYNIDFP